MANWCRDKFIEQDHYFHIKVFAMGPFGKCRPGFTTIEVIAVLIILGVIAGVVAYRFTGGVAAYSVQSVAEEVKNHLRYAQTRAMNSNAIWGVNFTDSTHYTIFKDGDTSHTVIPPGASSNTVNLGGSGVSLSSLGSGIVSFDDWGKPYTDAPAATAQSGTRSLTVSGGGQTVTIQITPNTGYIP